MGIPWDKWEFSEGIPWVLKLLMFVWKLKNTAQHSFIADLLVYNSGKMPSGLRDSLGF